MSRIIAEYRLDDSPKRIAMQPDTEVADVYTAGGGELYLVVFVPRRPLYERKTPVDRIFHTATEGYSMPDHWAYIGCAVAPFRGNCYVFEEKECPST